MFDDVVHNVWVRGYQVDSGSRVYLTFVRARTGSVLCTATLEREWWSQVNNPKKQEIKSSYVSKALSSAVPGGSAGGSHDADLAARCPALHEFLTLSIFPDGKPRQVSTLLLFTDGDLWKACLNERDAQVSLWATSESLQGLWDELEARLTAERVEWRTNRPKGSFGPSQGVDKKAKGR